MDELFINGIWLRSKDENSRPIIDPATEEIIAIVTEAGPRDTDLAIAAARAAFDEGPWPHVSAHERAKILLIIADELHRKQQELAIIETRNTGKPLIESTQDINDVIAVFRYYAHLVEEQTDRLIDVSTDIDSYIHHEPVGVCVLIAPWNYPLLQIAWKLAPALAAGCTVVVKPSELTPLSTIELVKIIAELVPQGVVNLLLGSGKNVGPRLTVNPLVDMISFTGGIASGAQISAQAAPYITRVTLELGGKNPHIIFADSLASSTAFEAAIDTAATAVFLHAGQVCSAGTRIIIEHGVAEEFTQALTEKATTVRLGNGLDSRSQSGPLISAQHLKKVEQYVQLGQTEGATLTTGGTRPSGSGLDRGYFYQPTVFANCDRGMRIVQEETFGPIATIEVFNSEAEAIFLGNDTRYGLAAGIRSNDIIRAQRVAHKLRHGTVWINDYGPYTHVAEWGGFKSSGNGRELGPTGLAEYQEQKHIWRKKHITPTGWFS